jgi:hypothetical protein
MGFKILLEVVQAEDGMTEVGQMVVIPVVEVHHQVLARHQGGSSSSGGSSSGGDASGGSSSGSTSGSSSSGGSTEEMLELAAKERQEIIHGDLTIHTFATNGT